MSIEQHVLDLIPAYTLGCLDDDDIAIVEQHLLTCVACQVENRLYQPLLYDLALAVPDATPPADLQDRLMARIAAPVTSTQPSEAPSLPPVAQSSVSSWEALKLAFRQSRAMWGVLALFICSMLLASTYLWQSVLQPIISPTRTPRPDIMKTIPLFPTEAGYNAHGTIVINLDTKQGALVIEDLHELDPSQQYQFWLARDQERIDGGVFNVDKYGRGIINISAPLPLSEYSGFGITIEPVGGSAAPTGNRVLRWGTERGVDP